MFAVSPACFVTARSLEQIKNDICYSDRPVKVVGISAGVSYGALGSTHHSLHDFAALRAIHNVTIVAPADNFETREAVLAVAKTEHPFISALEEGHARIFPGPLKSLSWGRRRSSARAPRSPSSPPAKRSPRPQMGRELLAKEGVECRVLSMHTIKPLDEAAVLSAAARPAE